MAIAAMILGPALFWAGYHRYKDRYRPEPLKFLAATYLLGIGAAYLASWGYRALDLVELRFDAYQLARDDLAGLWWYSILAIGLIEEAAKLLPFLLVAMRWRHFDEPVDGIIYASFIALGFASHENVEYLKYSSGWEALGRSIASPLVHVMFSSIWGYLIARAHFDRRPLAGAIALGLGLAALLHGAFDFITIGVPQWVRIGPPLIILAIWLWRIHLIERIQKSSAPVAPKPHDRSGNRLEP